MLIGIKIRLKPTIEQEKLFWKSAGVARWSYNFFLSETWRNLDEYKNGTSDIKWIKETEVRKYINNTLKKTTCTWLKDVGSNVMKQAVKDANEARADWLKGKTGKPKYKSKHKSKIAFYVNYESLTKKNGGFQGEKIGFVRTTTPLPILKSGQHYSNPRISYDGKNWFLSIGYEVETNNVELTDKTIGIDVGIKELAVCSDGSFKHNINKSKRVKQLKKRLKREQRKLNRKLLANTKGYVKSGKGRKPIYITSLKDMKNIQKQNKVIRKIHKQLTDIRTNHIHQSTSEIVKTKPSRVVMETLNIEGMKKNKHLSKAITEQKMYEFKRQMIYKCQRYGIEFIEADKWFPSSKRCSCCGNINKNLKLKDRVYKCSCGLVIDRDLNAAMNLANYPNLVSA